MKRSPLKRKKGIRPSLQQLLESGKVVRASSFIPKKRPTKKRKSSGQAAVFRSIWDSRPHRCEVCDTPIHEPRAINFSHILPKGAYPEYKLDPRNIEIWCADCHNKWTDKEDAGVMSLGWLRVLGKYNELMREANGVQ